MKYAALALSLFLVGCAHTQGPDFVNIGVAVKCKTADPAKPSYRYSPPYENVFDGTRDLLGDRELSQAYEKELEAALRSCK